MTRRLLCFFVVCALVGGCGGPVDEGPTITLWHSYRGAEREALETITTAWDERHPEVRLEVLAVPSKAYKSRLQSAIPRGNGPDLFIEAHELTGEWSGSKLLLPAVLPPELTMDDFAAASVEALTFRDEVWGVPIAVKSAALFQNRGLVAETPSTFEEALAAGREVGQVAIAYEAGEFYFHAPLLHAFGGRALGPDGEPTLDSPEVIASLEYVAGLTASGDLPPEADGATVSTLFNQGRVAFVISGPWFLGEIREGIDYTVSPLPYLEAAGASMQPFLTVESLFRAAWSEAPEDLIADVVGAIAGLDGSILRAVQGRQIPALRAARDRPEVASDPVLSAFAAQADTAVPMPNRPEMSFVWEPAARALRAALRGKDPAEMAARAQHEVESFLRPPAEAVSPTPYIAVLSLLLMFMAGWSVRAARERQIIVRARKSWRSYLYLAPAFVGMVGVVFIPFVLGAAVSLFAHRDGEFTFVGLLNFVRILTSDTYPITDPMSFWFTLVVTVVWTVANVTLHVGIGLGLAMLLRDPWMKMRGVYRVLLIIPWAVPNYITALIWKGMFNEQFGAINGVLAMVGVEPVAWFSRFATSFAANLCTNTWLGFPFMMVVTLGALQAIPRDLEEAAEVDGAGAWTRFRHVTLPLLRPALLPAVILGSVWTFNMFNVIYLVSAGDPDGGTEILISEAYKWAFTRQAQYGYASAYALLVFGILVMYALLTKRVTGGKGS
jgi:arabinogalactan oligomer/maltooligosaccharide transport system permease protein